MYEISKCGQEIGKEIPEKLMELYAYPSEADLAFANITAEMKGKYLDTIITIENEGLQASKEANLLIYADDKLVEEIALDPIDFGEGKIITMQNIFVLKLNVNQLKFEIDAPFSEMDKENNEMILEIKN
jgi:hypothetical protein